ncbi:MAG: hypothetical protein A2Y24_00250 [Clostridiales bacterium GWE2_32_10]|nr:MAG: hypothetical protein A2Y24_00250 [Clostridiales bacterium GWE2_32_10]
MKVLVYLSIIGAIISDVVYHFSEMNIPKDINPLFAISMVYLIASSTAFIISYIVNKKQNIVKELKKVNWAIIVLSISLVVMEVSFLLIYRVGGELSKIYNIVSLVESIALVVIGIVMYSEKLNTKNIIGIIFAMVGITMLAS